MVHKEELEPSLVKINLSRGIAILERDIESPLRQCDSRIAIISMNTTKNNYDAFMNNQISREELIDNNNKIGAITRKFVDMCSCMREKVH